MSIGARGRLALVGSLGLVLGACGGGSSGGSPGGGSQGAARYVFITSNGMPSSNMGGLAGVDAFCATYASAGGLAGTWKAWMSDEATNAVDRINDVGPWYLVGTTTVAAANKLAFATTPAVMIDVTQTGARLGSYPIGAATGTTASGMKSPGNTCSSWTATTGFYAAIQMQPASIWQVTSGGCSSGGGNRVICIQQ